MNLAKTKIIKCHKYSEYEIKPIKTNGFIDRIRPRRLSELQNIIIKEVPIIGIKV